MYLEPDSQQIRHVYWIPAETKRDSLGAVRRNRLKRLEDEPQKPDFHYDIGLIYFIKISWKKQSSTFVFRLNLPPNAVIVWLNLGRLLKNKGQDTAARQALLIRYWAWSWSSVSLSTFSHYWGGKWQLWSRSYLFVESQIYPTIISGQAQFTITSKISVRSSFCQFPLGGDIPSPKTG